MWLVFLTLGLLSCFVALIVGAWVAGPRGQQTSTTRRDGAIVGLVMLAVLAAASYLAPIALTGGLQR